MLRHWNCLVKRCNHHPLEMFRSTWMWHVGTRFDGEYGGAEGLVGLHELGGLVQPKQFCDSVIPVVS